MGVTFDLRWWSSAQQKFELWKIVLNEYFMIDINLKKDRCQTQEYFDGFACNSLPLMGWKVKPRNLTESNWITVQSCCFTTICIQVAFYNRPSYLAASRTTMRVPVNLHEVIGEQSIKSNISQSTIKLQAYSWAERIYCNINKLKENVTDVPSVKVLLIALSYTGIFLPRLNWSLANGYIKDHR